MNKLYHVSSVANIKVLEPRVSTHEKAYVYATSNLEMALLFGSKKSYGDFDGIYGVLDDGRPYFYEAYQGAFERRFKGETCYIYQVKPDTFKKGKTSFSAEVVSSKPVEFIKCTKVDDLYNYLQKLISKGKIVFHEYSLDKDYQEKINNHIANRVVLFKVLEKGHPMYNFCKEKFPEIIKKFENEDTLKNNAK